MDTTAITTALSAATTLFGVCVTLAVLVTGFMVGRHWLKKAGYDSDIAGGEDSPLVASTDPTDHGYLGATHHENGNVTVHHEDGDKNFRREDYDEWQKRWK